jgi:S-adenosylmethionine hydrolase
MTVITLTTDFGLRDGFVGIMKGVIYGIAPEVDIVDISHAIAPQDVLEGAFTLRRAAPYFPPGTIHVYVVDPGVGTDRRPLAARLGDHFFVGPDNGLLTPLIEDAEQKDQPRRFVHLDNPKYWLPQISRTFHGRDIFSPAAAHLANKVPLSELGTPVHDPVRLALPAPKKTEIGWRGEVTHIDHFGNVATNIRVEHLGEAMQEKEKIIVRLHDIEIKGMVNTFGERAVGELVALIGSAGNLGVAVVNGSAAERLRAKMGDAIEVIYR